jgi:hypothetical protein
MVLADVAVAPTISSNKHHDCSDDDSCGFHIQYAGQLVLFPGSIKFW